MPSDTYSREEVAEIFARATELEARTIAALPPGHSYSLAEAKAFAVEAGIDPELIERAAWDVRIAAASRRTGIVARRVETDFPTTLSQYGAARVLAAVRSSVEEQGISEASAAGLSWQSKDGTLLMTAHETAGLTRLKIASSAWRGVSASALLGVVAGMVAADLMAPVTMEVFFGSAAVGVTVGTALMTAAIAKARRQSVRIFEAASDALRTSERPTRDADEAAE